MTFGEGRFFNNRKHMSFVIYKKCKSEIMCNFKRIISNRFKNNIFTWFSIENVRTRMVLTVGVNRLTVSEVLCFTLLSILFSISKTNQSEIVQLVGYVMMNHHSNRQHDVS